MEPIDISSGINTLILINGATLIAILALGFKVVRYLHTMEFKLDILWEDYNERKKRYGSPLVPSNFKRSPMSK